MVGAMDGLRTLQATLLVAVSTSSRRLERDKSRHDELRYRSERDRLAACDLPIEAV